MPGSLPAGLRLAWSVGNVHINAAADSLPCTTACGNPPIFQQQGHQVCLTESASAPVRSCLFVMPAKHKGCLIMAIDHEL